MREVRSDVGGGGGTNLTLTVHLELVEGHGGRGRWAGLLVGGRPLGIRPHRGGAHQPGALQRGHQPGCQELCGRVVAATDNTHIYFTITNILTINYLIKT